MPVKRLTGHLHYCKEKEINDPRHTARLRRVNDKLELLQLEDKQLILDLLQSLLD